QFKTNFKYQVILKVKLLKEKVTKKKRVHCRMTLIKLQNQCNTPSHPLSKTTRKSRQKDF
ncbi:hypothetical protein EGQ24_08135, partial [bacterium]|nr:hypothetical protein [bacterium]